MRVMMIVASALSYFINDAIAKARYKNADTMNFEAPLTSLVWITSIVSVVITFVVSYLTIPTSAATRRSGGNSRSSSPAARSRARSFPSW